MFKEEPATGSVNLSPTDSELLQQIAEDAAELRRFLSASVEFAGLARPRLQDPGSDSAGTPVLGV